MMETSAQAAPVGPQPSTPVHVWRARFRASRQAREQRVSDWYAWMRLHARAYTAVQEGNEDRLSWLPNGDLVRLGLVHRNVEQTMGVLEVPEVHIGAEATEWDRELGREDQHRESVVSQALTQSLRDSGLVDGPNLADMVKLAGVIIGHGVTYTQWRTVSEDVPVGWAMEFEDAGDGTLTQVLDDEGQPAARQATISRVIREECEDLFISPLDFLFDPQAPSIALSRWHGHEEIVALADLKKDGRFQLPEGLTDSRYRATNLYGEDVSLDQVSEMGVALVWGYDKRHRELVAFVEQSAPDSHALVAPGRENAWSDGKSLVPVLVERFPVAFDLPNDSPYSAFVPITAVDEPFGVSQVMHIRNPAIEADKLRTRQANITRQIKRILTFNAQSGLSEDQINQALASADFSVLKVNNTDGRPLSELIDELNMGQLHPELFQGIEQAKNDVAGTSGVTDVPWGGANTATESENINAVGSARVNRKRGLFLRYLAQVARVHKAFMATFAPDGRTVQVIGIDGVPLLMAYGREAFQGRFNLTANPGNDKYSASPVEKKADLELLAILDKGLAGMPHARVHVLRWLLTKWGQPGIEPLLRAVAFDLQAQGIPPMGMPQGPALPGGVDGNLLAAGGNPNDQLPQQAVRAGINMPNEGMIGG